MKASDVASKNHITFEDLLEVCKDLSISCDSEDLDINEKDIFLIEKKIEVIKTKKVKKAEGARKSKKIKLKRKVTLAKDRKEPVEEEKKKEEKKPADKKAAPAGKGQEGQKSDRKPAERGKPSDTRRPRPGQGNGKPGAGKPGAGKPGFGKPGGKPGGKPYGKTDEKPSGDDKASASKSASDKKLKKKDRDKEKARYKKEQQERGFAIKKKEFQKKREVVTPDEIAITENVSVGELAKKLNVKASEVIAKLMKMEIMVTINQSIDAETAEILALEYGTNVKVVSLYDETVIKSEEQDLTEDRKTRAPIVTIMGHVDHGKTKLLDTIREANVVDKEHGGITQHIGAYQVSVNEKKITFLDTPGHSAFTTMRARGASITDIVVLVVAANDGVMPQTIEGINHAKAAGVPIIVAINKIDLPEANASKVRQELANYELIPEEWGGTTLFAEISAKQNINIDGLLELITIQAEMLELKANNSLRAKGTVVEAKLDPGRGAVSTILIQNGTLRMGDPFVVGIYSGKVRAMFDDQGRPIKEAGPAKPVEVLGTSGVPQAGDPFEGVESDKFAKQISQKRLEYKRIEAAKKVRKVTLESLNDMIRDGEVQELGVIVKADVDGSAQALTEALEKLSNDEIRVKVIHAGTGGINDSDVMLAAASNAIIIGYHVRPTGKVAELAEREDVSIKYYNIIFEATDDIKAALEGMLSPEYQEEIIGTGEVKQIFKVSKIGSIAGSICLTGKIVKTAKMRLIRNGVVINDAELHSLKRYKDDVNEVVAGQEFGFSYESFHDIKEGDNFEAYRINEIAKTL